MRVVVVRPDDLGPSEAALWAKFQHSSPITLNPFLSLSFAQAVGRARPTACVAVVEESNKIESFLPYELTSKRIARPIGWPMNDLQGFIGSGMNIDPRSVVKKAGLRGWRFDHALAEQRMLAPYCYPGTISPTWEMDLTNGYTAYLNNLSKTIVRKTGQKRRALERQFGDVRLQWSSPASEHFRTLIDWKTDQYRRTGVQELFSDPGTLRIVEELAATNYEDCRGVMSALLAGERLVAVHFGIQGPGYLSSWFPAYDQELSRFSPGMIMWFTLAEEASNWAVARISLGYGKLGFKMQVASESYGVVEGAVWASRIEQASRNLQGRLLSSSFLLNRVPKWARSRLRILIRNPRPGIEKLRIAPMHGSDKS